MTFIFRQTYEIYLNIVVFVFLCSSCFIIRSAFYLWVVFMQSCYVLLPSVKLAFQLLCERVNVQEQD
jgi:hypothetical protein